MKINHGEKLVIIFLLLLTGYFYIYHPELVDYTFLSGVALGILGVLNADKIFSFKKKNKRK